jgi:selenophosphate synthase
MFKLDVQRLGCGQKLEMQMLMQIGGYSDLRVNDDASFARVSGLEVCSSIDRIGRMSSNVVQFVEIAVLHALNDVLVADAQPRIVSICIEFGPEFTEVSDFVELTIAARDILRRYDVELQNLHSVRSDYTHLTLSVLGTRRNSAHDRFSEGVVYLTREIGASKMMIMREIEGENSDFFARQIIDKRYLGVENAGISATDVTGFGLAGAALNLCSRLDLYADLHLGRDCLIDNDVVAVPFSCFEATGLPNGDFRASCSRSEMIARCVEFAGPVLIFVPFRAKEEFLLEFSSRHSWPPIEIGTFSSIAAEHRVSITWRD